MISLIKGAQTLREFSNSGDRMVGEGIPRRPCLTGKANKSCRHSFGGPLSVKAGISFVLLVVSMQGFQQVMDIRCGPT